MSKTRSHEVYVPNAIKTLRLRSSGMWRHVVWRVVSDISEQTSAVIIREEGMNLDEAKNS